MSAIKKAYGSLLDAVRAAFYAGGKKQAMLKGLLKNE
jgi:hypothetical protein